MASNTIRDYGDQALLLECESTEQVLAVAAALRRAQAPEVLDIVPAARTVLITLSGPHHQAPTRQRLAQLRIDDADSRTDRDTEVVIEVVYDGADLADVAELTGMDVDAVIDAHTATPWRVGFGGFAPGFAYLVGGDPRLAVPRRSDPRTAVPAGSVALAGEFSGIYPRQSPGGWQLIGRTDAVLWDIERPQPALLEPGMWVRFRAVR
ncbi:KipI family sensor histidine kinase inhibitor [Mycolicibacterium sp. BK556]|uniref:5-oxoprolinase subunit B family protein n=1 Tax=unclassified Mycolicibacterium TaxID=2636767 RepID=UPI001615BC50|nr:MULTISPECIES: allophanate hydrolase subunit 1 [unclassified Mycolicibacterium]MBB3600679.1 KipI family sensor histidine kinase inhibitor [Mycolicibacterium sp. BK556]MBB3630432.1 KipI family sensor histidine kinase inhibitor [Mycolicibacterium sp. BK607]MBB3748423.1 KipI family sensor histidine kinase inhibitor [Mycolicibacterium sp. BK634]